MRSQTWPARASALINYRSLGTHVNSVITRAVNCRLRTGAQQHRGEPVSSAATLFLIVQSKYWLLENKLYFCRSGLSCSAFEARRIFEFLVLALECGLKNTYILHARSLSAPRPAFQFLVLTSLMLSYLMSLCKMLTLINFCKCGMDDSYKAPTLARLVAGVELNKPFPAEISQTIRWAFPRTLMLKLYHSFSLGARLDLRRL
ncbi:KLTH0E09526p [Lachancea thermotolerans CBS 6340]|uniref:KLTH0E09526p n=1 Tax=Lachancea thermotolerans (strain ATCC 56472 / CBS 6340 / NRRL Y-8284) TaxID=559295 RepID=C5DI41_LACTC|nr:KLTH0E09526p [Lachancea thermotolerans CBS 6340]CAR23452.1 KLTH0E09526p [Lachancea thermotolerans CBS 6340]